MMMSNPNKYPRWIKTKDGVDMIVQNHQQHSALTGVEHDSNAEPTVKRPKPPTIEEVLAAGYSHTAAASIFITEKAKAEQGIEPYGDVPRETFVQPLFALPEAPAVEKEEDLAGMFGKAGA